MKEEDRDYINIKFGRLTVVGNPYRKYPKETSKQKRTFVKTICECGKEHEVQLMELKTGGIVSCGCFLVDWMKKNITTHGLRNHPTYDVWLNMRRRCNEVTNKSYCHYGGRGISVCDEWENNFKVFYDWAISNGWNTELQLDRENNDGNYEPLNCRFVDTNTQARNKRSNKLSILRVRHIRILYKSNNYTKKRLSELYGVAPGTISKVIRNKIWIV